LLPTTVMPLILMVTHQPLIRILYSTMIVPLFITCQELEDAEAIYEELVRYEHENQVDPFDVQICLDQIEWGQTHRPRKTLFVLTARKL